MKQKKPIYEKPMMAIFTFSYGDVLTLSVQDEFTGNLGNDGIEILPDGDY